jgi:hypothetical protein
MNVIKAAVKNFQSFAAAMQRKNEAKRIDNRRPRKEAESAFIIKTGNAA